MKKIFVKSRKEDFSKIKEVLNSINATQVQVDGKERTITLYVSEEAVDEVIGKLVSAMDLRYKENMIEVSSLDFVITRVTNMKNEDKTVRTPVEQLIYSTRKYMKLDFGKIALTSIASLVAMTGLLLNNPTIVIGAMLLSPLLGPIYSFAINTAVGKLKDAIISVAVLAVLLFSSFILSVISAAFLSVFYNVPTTAEISLREIIYPIYVPMAILLGFASLLALANGMLESIVGVAVATALLPPVVVSGLMTVINFSKAAAPAIIVLQNVLGLMSGSLIAVLVLNIGPRRYYEKATAKRYMARVLYILSVLLIIVTILSVIFGKR
ncbi:MAG TPA: TIGR00341 family protein [Thermofilum sp.]|nr:TIGR00341 family protein [Thermofilum sp.]